MKGHSKREREKERAGMYYLGVQLHRNVNIIVLFRLVGQSIFSNNIILKE